MCGWKTRQRAVISYTPKTTPDRELTKRCRMTLSSVEFNMRALLRLRMLRVVSLRDVEITNFANVMSYSPPDFKRIIKVHVFESRRKRFTGIKSAYHGILILESQDLVIFFLVNLTAYKCFETYTLSFPALGKRRA
jgi:hypothetical protein